MNQDKKMTKDNTQIRKELKTLLKRGDMKQCAENTGMPYAHILNQMQGVTRLSAVVYVELLRIAQSRVTSS